jgi:hypothetical protein
MASCLPEELRECWGDVSRLPKAISEYAALLERDNGTEIRRPWPQELAIKFGAKGYNEMECLGAWQLIGRNQIVGLIDTVRNKVLDFSLQIEAAAFRAGEAFPDAPAVPQERITQVFHTVITGGVNNVSAGGASVQQTNYGQIKSGDLAALLAALRVAGVAEEPLVELQSVLISDPDPKKAAESWLGKLAISGAQGAITTTLGIAAKAISAYFGIPS